MHQACMLITGANPLFAIHLVKLTWTIQDSDCAVPRNSEIRCGKLECLNIENYLINATSSFLTNIKPTHHFSQRFVSRTRRLINKSKYINKGFAGIRYFHAIGKYLNHGPGAGYAEILVDKRIGNQFTNSDLRVSSGFLSERLTEEFI